MPDAYDIAENAAASPAPDMRDDDDRIAQDFLAAVETAIDTDDIDALKALTVDLHEADLGDLIEALSRDEQTRLVAMLGGEFDFTALTEIDEALRVRLLEAMPPEAVAEGVRDLESDDAVSILEDLDDPEKEAILEQLPVAEQMPIRRALDYPEDSAGRLIQSDFIAVPTFWTVGQTIDYMREAEDLPDEFYEIYVIDPGFRLVGSVPLDRILRTGRPRKIIDITNEETYRIAADDDQEEVARLFERYNLLSAAVTDDAGRLVGVITIDDIVDVIQEEAEEDIMRLGGVGDEEISDRVVDTARSRFTWLFVNLITAVLASLVIGLFDATIEQMVALAVLMPIVASMGGNAGTQTMTVAVRALATRDLDTHNFGRVVGREVLVSVINGAALAVIVGIVAYGWFGSVDLGLVIALAMVINLLFAGLSGILIPVGLEKLDIDPAIASSVFVTTVTDVIGFFAFLGLSGWWFGLL